jgi:adenine-specific DNA methylase
MTCSRGHATEIVAALRRHPIQQRMYAKLVRTRNDEREYRAIDGFDLGLFRRARQLLAKHSGQLVHPVGRLEAGHSTAQALRWGFGDWKSFFNARQLYAHGLIGAAIRELPAGSPEREALSGLFTKVLEFNNVFASYKGEGTGAVRPLFHNHTLKPERTPLEANPWGETTASGSMPALFSRLLRAASYKEAPTDLVSGQNGTTRCVTGLSLPTTRPIVTRFRDLASHSDPAAYVNCGDSSSTDIPDHSIDLVVTDPPYFRKVHYSELADFFHAWLSQLRPYPQYPTRVRSTRHSKEVQTGDPRVFRQGLTRVWSDVGRVLRPRGLLVFSFNESNVGAWYALMAALREGGFVVTGFQPVMAEMATSLAKSGAREPSHLDAIVVCRKRGHGSGWAVTPQDAARKAKKSLQAMAAAGIDVSDGDVRSFVSGGVISLVTVGARSKGDELRREATSLAKAAVAEFQRRRDATRKGARRRRTGK